MHSQVRRDADAFSRLKEELRVVYVELAARDRELNTMTAAHTRQMEAWVCFVSNPINIDLLFFHF